jgi:hypothetical protein
MIFSDLPSPKRSRFGFAKAGNRFLPRIKFRGMRFRDHTQIVSTGRFSWEKPSDQAPVWVDLAIKHH